MQIAADPAPNILLSQRDYSRQVKLADQWIRISGLIEQSDIAEVYLIVICAGFEAYFAS